jgi:Zn-finger nucleic acid-binding protein
MQRRNFQKTSGVIVDRCRSHGTWLDADELERIAGFLLSGGRPQATAFLKGQEAQDEARYQSARRDKIAAEHGMRGLGLPRTSSHDGGGLSLLGLLSDLLD